MLFLAFRCILHHLSQGPTQIMGGTCLVVIVVDPVPPRPVLLTVSVIPARRGLPAHRFTPAGQAAPVHQATISQGPMGDFYRSLGQIQAVVPAGQISQGRLGKAPQPVRMVAPLGQTSATQGWVWRSPRQIPKALQALRRPPALMAPQAGAAQGFPGLGLGAAHRRGASRGVEPRKGHQARTETGVTQASVSGLGLV